MLKNYLLVFYISMVPIIELRGAIPIGLGMGLPVLPTYLVCVIGNMIPVPFIYLFARKFLIWGYHKPLVGPICRFCINKGEKGGRALEAKAGRGLPLALLLFVGIPLPGTGAWTGTLAGSILDPVMALPLHLYHLAMDLPGTTELQYGTATVLLIIVLVFFVAASLIRSHYSKKVRW